LALKHDNFLERLEIGIMKNFIQRAFNMLISNIFQLKMLKNTMETIILWDKL